MCSPLESEKGRPLVVQIKILIFVPVPSAGTNLFVGWSGCIGKTVVE